LDLNVQILLEILQGVDIWERIVDFYSSNVSLWDMRTMLPAATTNFCRELKEKPAKVAKFTFSPKRC